MSELILSLPDYYINDKDVSEEVFISETMKEINKLVTKYDVVHVKLKNDDIDLTKTSSFKEKNTIKKQIQDFIDKTYLEYDTKTENNELLVYAYDRNENGIKLLECTAEMIQRPKVDDDQSVKFDYGNIEDKDAIIPTLSHKTYSSFVALCNETKDFLYDYAEIGKKNKDELNKNNINAIGKAIFAPIKAWDSVGTECKMKKEDFELLKANLVQYSIENACVDLGSYSWKDVFAWMADRKTKSINSNSSNNMFVAKIKTKVIDSKKQKLGTIIVILSIFVDESSYEQEKRGELNVLTSNISFNVIAR